MEQDIQQSSQLNFDPIEGAEIMTMAGIKADDLQISSRLEKVEGIIDFFKGKEDKGYLIKKLLMGKAVDPVDHLHEYINLRKDFSSRMDELRRLEQEIALFE